MCSEYVRCGFGCLVDPFLAGLEVLDIVGVGNVVVSFRSVGVVLLGRFGVDASAVGSDCVYVSIC